MNKRSNIDRLDAVEEVIFALQAHLRTLEREIENLIEEKNNLTEKLSQVNELVIDHTSTIARQEIRLQMTPQKVKTEEQGITRRDLENIDNKLQLHEAQIIGIKDRLTTIEDSIHQESVHDSVEPKEIAKSVEDNLQ